MSLCILIPAHNEEVVLQNTLDSIYEAGFSPESIYCVDDFSTDCTYDICIQNKINVCRTPVNLGKAGAQKHAIEHFQLCNKYKYVIMMDADTRVGEKFKQSLLINLLTRPNVDLFVGQVASSKANHIYSAYRAIEYTFSHDVIKKGQDTFNVIYVAPGCVSVYSTNMLKKLEFDSSILTEDMDLTIQVHRLGGKIKYIHDMKVITQDPYTLKDYHKQMLRWYRGFWQVISKYSTRSIKLQSVNLYLMYLIFDSLVFNRAFVLLLSLMLLPLNVVWLGLFFDLCIFSLIAAYAAYKNKRPDVLYKAPVTYFLSFFNTYAYIRGFIEVIVFRRKETNWNKVKRYGENV